MSTLTEAVREAVAGVMDPELPVVTIEQLGILEEVRVNEASGRVEVDLIPTFLGCPALDVIETDVSVAAGSVDGVREVAVRFRSEPQWSPARISREGRRNLARGLTIAVTPPDGPTLCPVCGSTGLEERSPFGPTACRAVSYCGTCRNPVEVVRGASSGAGQRSDGPIGDGGRRGDAGRRESRTPLSGRDTGLDAELP